MDRRERLEKEIEVLNKQLLECFNERLVSDDPARAVTLEAKESSLDEKIRKKEREFNQLTDASNSENQRALNLDEGFCNIDFEQAKELIRDSVNILNASEGGAALFLMEQCRDHEGHLLLNSLRDILQTNTRQLLEYPVAFSPIAPANELAFLKALGSYLKLSFEDTLTEEPNQRLQAIAAEVIQEMASLLRSGTTVLIPLSNWQKVGIDYQVCFLEWLMDTFWQQLVMAMSKVMEDYSPKVFFVIMVDGELSEPCQETKYFCEKEALEQEKILCLPLTYWTQSDVKRWLDSYSSKLKKDQRDELVMYIFDGKDEDMPLRVRKALEDAHAKSYF